MSASTESLLPQDDSFETINLNSLDATGLDAAAEFFGFQRHHFQQRGQFETSHVYFQKEMYCIQLKSSFAKFFPYWIFGTFSSYGQSIAKPIFCLFIVWAVGFPLFQGCTISDAFCLLDPPTNRSLSSWDAAGLSLANMFKFLGFQSLYFDKFLSDEHLSDGIKVAASVQTGLSFVLLFFLGLGLRSRSRFRLR